MTLAEIDHQCLITAASIVLADDQGDEVRAGLGRAHLDHLLDLRLEATCPASASR